MRIETIVKSRRFSFYATVALTGGKEFKEIKIYKKNIQWESLESAGGDDHQFLLLTQDCFLTQHVLEPTRGENVLDLILSSQNELVDNVKAHEPLGSSDHNQI